jgi:PAS domain S-box-containing protein
MVRSPFELGAWTAPRNNRVGDLFGPGALGTGKIDKTRQVQPMKKSGERYADDLFSDFTGRVRAVETLRQEHDFISAVLDTASALVVVLDRQGRIVRFNRACERATGYSFHEVRGKLLWDLFLIPEEVEPVKAVFEELQAGQFPNEYENHWVTKHGDRRLIAWSNTALLGADGTVECVIAAPASTSPTAGRPKKPCAQPWCAPAASRSF